VETSCISDAWTEPCCGAGRLLAAHALESEMFCGDRATRRRLAITPKRWTITILCLGVDQVDQAGFNVAWIIRTSIGQPTNFFEGGVELVPSDMATS